MTTQVDRSWTDAFTTLPPDGVEASLCPDPERIWSAARGELLAGEFGELLDHTADCPLCALAWRMAITAPADKPAARAGRPWRPWYGYAAAAAAVMIVALALQFGDRTARPVTGAPEYRAPMEDVVSSAIPPGTALKRDDCTLRWSGPEGAKFDLIVADAAYEILHRESGLDELEFTVSATALREVPAGGVLYWHVEAVFPDGTRRPSRTFRVTLE